MKNVPTVVGCDIMEARKMEDFMTKDINEQYNEKK